MIAGTLLSCRGWLRWVFEKEGGGARLIITVCKVTRLGLNRHIAYQNTAAWLYEFLMPLSKSSMMVLVFLSAMEECGNGASGHFN